MVQPANVLPSEPLAVRWLPALGALLAALDFVLIIFGVEVLAAPAIPAGAAASDPNALSVTTIAVAPAVLPPRAEMRASAAVSSVLTETRGARQWLAHGPPSRRWIDGAWRTRGTPAIPEHLPLDRGFHSAPPAITADPEAGHAPSSCPSCPIGWQS